MNSKSLTKLVLAMIIRYLNVQIKCLERIFPLNDVFIEHLNVQKANPADGHPLPKGA
jgi:hypothetical protein